MVSHLSNLKDEEFELQFSLLLEIKTLIENRIQFSIKEFHNNIDDESDTNEAINSINSQVNDDITSYQAISTYAEKPAITQTIQSNDQNFEVSKLNLLKGNTVGAKKKTKAKPTFLKAQLQLRDRVINLNHSRIITRTSIDSNNLSEFSLNASVFHSPAVSILKKKTATSKSSKFQTKLIPSTSSEKTSKTGPITRSTLKETAAASTSTTLTLRSKSKSTSASHLTKEPSRRGRKTKKT